MIFLVRAQHTCIQFLFIDIATNIVGQVDTQINVDSLI